MSLNRGRNIFTLGGFRLPKYPFGQPPKPRQHADPFERDPFKIQSYNFHYAERPIFPVKPTLRQQQQQAVNYSSARNSKPFDTYFYNHDFPRTSINDRGFTNNPYNSGLNRQENRDLNLTKFQEYRRRKFVQNQRNSSTQGHSPGFQYPIPVSATSNLNSSSFGFPAQQQPHVASSAQNQRNSSTQGLSLGFQYPRPVFTTSNLNSSTFGFPAQQPQLSSSVLKRSFTDNFLEPRNRAGQTAPSNGYVPQRTAPSFGNNGNVSSTLKRSFTEHFLEPTKASSLLAHSSDTEYNVGNTNCAGASSMCQARDQAECGAIKYPSSHSFLMGADRESSASRVLRDNTLQQPSQFPHNARKSSHQSLASTSKRKLSIGSGCEININIKSLGNDSISDNVTIQIETDPKKKINLMNNLATPSNIKSNMELNINPSSSSFVIDKRLSKISVNSNIGGRSSAHENAEKFSRHSLNNERLKRSPIVGSQSQIWERKQLPENQRLRDKQRERTIALNSAYSPQSLKPPMRKSSMRAMDSSERMPSMVPWRDDRKSEDLRPHNKKSLHRLKENLRYPLTDLRGSPRQSIVNTKSETFTNSSANRVNTALNSTSKLSIKRLILQKFHSSKQALLRSQHLKALPTLAKPATWKTPMKCCMPVKKPRRFWSKLPLKVNIKVFAEKVKLLQV